MRAGRAHRHHFVAMRQQLPQIARGGQGNPDVREAVRQLQNQQMLGVPRVGFLGVRGVIWGVWVIHFGVYPVDISEPVRVALSVAPVNFEPF